VAEPSGIGDSQAYCERLRVPWSWWPVLLIVVVIGVLEVGSGFTWTVIIPVAVFLVGFMIVPLALNGLVAVRVGDGRLTAGKESIPVTALTSVQPLTREQARLRLGPQADPAALAVVRGWIGPAVMVRLSNPDPVPYWIVSSRHPEALAAAIKQARSAARDARTPSR
jgi:hypothetical protein